MPNYWEQFGKQTHSFWNGVREGIKAYAVWKDGDQLVGIMRQPIKEVFREIEAAVNSNLSVDPLHYAAMKYLDETGQMPDVKHWEMMKAKCDVLVELIENNALVYLYDIDEIAREKLEEL
ncbi:MAG: hypothetical protein ACW99G_01770 [Candidatus Thorarchaeota archaeon]|jgi:hypothetical protein